MQWVGVYGLGALSVGMAVPLGPVLRLLGIALLFAMAAAWQPRRPPRLLRETCGRWSVPEWRAFGLVLAAPTRYTAWWVELALRSPDGRLIRLLLLRDQFPAAAWWALQAGLRTDSWQLPRTTATALIE